MEDETTQQAIFRVVTEIDQAHIDLKAAKETLDSEVEQLDEYKTVQDLKLQLKDAERMLKLAKNTRTINTLMEEVGEYRYKLRDLAEILSHHLVAYYRENGSTELETPGGRSVRHIILSAQLTKPVKKEK